jgi:hypothetical protein
MELRRTPRRRGSILFRSSVTALHLRPQIHLQLRRESRAFYSAHLHQQTQYSNISQAAADRGIESRPAVTAATPLRQGVLRIPEALVRHLSTLRSLQPHTRLFSVLERAQQVSGQPIVASDTVQHQITSLFQLVHHRSQRVEDTAVRISREVSVRKVGAPFTPPLRSPAPISETHPGGRESNRPVDSVHVAPWLKTAPPALSIEQLTEHVIRHIDSRMIACRERMGKY